MKDAVIIEQITIAILNGAERMHRTLGYSVAKSSAKEVFNAIRGGNIDVISITGIKQHGTIS
jgi:hypothetical protein